MKKKIALVLVIISVIGLFTISVSAYNTGSYTVNTPSGVNVRTGAGSGYSRVGAASNGVTFSVSSISGSWGYTSSIRCTNGTRSGWVCLDYCKYNGSGGGGNNSNRSTYNDVFASTKGRGYQLSQARSAEATRFTKGTYVYVWGFLHDINDNLYKSYGSGTCNMTLAVYRPDGSCKFSYTYNNCDCNWIGVQLDTAGTWKIQSKITGSLTGNNVRSISVSDPSPKTVDPSGVYLNYSSMTLNYGSSRGLSATVYPSNATNKSVYWYSSNSTVASVSGGWVYTNSPGCAMITAKTCNGKTASCNVYVKGVKINDELKTIYEGDVRYLSTSSYGVSSSRKWSSSNSSVLSVSSSGKVTAKKAGSATITVITGDGYSHSRTFKVFGTAKSRSVNFSNNNSYVTVSLNTNCGAGYVQIYTYDLAGYRTNARIHITLRDWQGNWIWEGDANSGCKLRLGNDHSSYRVYVRPASYSDGIIDQGNSFINSGKCHTWKLTCTSNTYIN